MLTQRWGIFWRMFRFSFDRWSLVVMVCMKLHNLCMDRGVQVPAQHFAEDVREGNTWLVHDSTQDDDTLLRGRSSGECRREVTQQLEQQ
jgi:hypothetical protein